MNDTKKIYDIPEESQSRTSYHEAAHLLMYMVGIAMVNKKKDFVDECYNRIDYACVKKCFYDSEDGTRGYITTCMFDRYQTSDAYKMMVSAGVLGTWCRYLKISDEQHIRMSLRTFAFAVRNYDSEKLKNLFEDCGGKGDHEHLVEACQKDGTNITDFIEDAIRIFGTEEFIVLWENVSSLLFTMKVFSKDEIKRLAEVYCDNIYIISEKMKKAKQKFKNRTWVGKVWHRICRNTLYDTTIEWL